MIKRIHKALRNAKEEAGTQKKLEAKTGVGQCSIAAFLNGSRKIENMTVKTLLKLFPEMQITFTASNREQNEHLGNSEDPVLRELLQTMLKMNRKELNKLNDYIVTNFTNS